MFPSFVGPDFVKSPAPLWRYGASKIMGSRPWPWCHRSRDHSTCDGPLHMGGPLWPCTYLAPLWRYGASKLGTGGCTHARSHAWTDAQVIFILCPMLCIASDRQ